MLERNRGGFAHIAEAFLGFAPNAVEAGSLRPTLASLGVDPNQAEAFAGAVTDAAPFSAPGNGELDLPQLVLVGMCVGLRLGATSHGSRRGGISKLEGRGAA